MKEIIEQIYHGDLTDDQLRHLIRKNLLTTEDAMWIDAKGWGVLDILYGWNTLSHDPNEALEESQHISDIVNRWNQKLGQRVFGVGG